MWGLGGLARKEGTARPLPLQPLGLKLSPSFAQAPTGEAVGSGTSPFSLAKNSGPQVLWKAPGAGEEEAGWQSWGPAGNVRCAVPARQQRLPWVGTAPWKVPGSAFRPAGGKSLLGPSGWTSGPGGLPLTSADESGPVSCLGLWEGQRKVVLSPFTALCLVVTQTSPPTGHSLSLSPRTSHSADIP